MVMKYHETLESAADMLRAAVPLMVKYKIPPHPTNYALWYSYVRNKDAGLNAELDSLVADGQYPEDEGYKLFVNFILKEEMDAIEERDGQVQSLVNELLQQIKHASEGSQGYANVLNEAKTQMQDQDVDMGVLVSKLAEATQKSMKQTQDFQGNINKAQKEIESLKAELQKSRRESHIDQLTQLYNRRAFDVQLGQLAGNATTAKNLFLVIMDVDHFKLFNDTYGHLLGDLVLKGMGKILSGESEANMIACRYGGEEFALILPNTDKETAYQQAEKIRKKIQCLHLKDKRTGQNVSNISASFGVTRFVSGEEIADFIARADKALYQAKENGRNQVIVGC